MKKVCMLSHMSMIFDSRIQKEAIALRDEGYEVTILCIEDQEMMHGLPDARKLWSAYHERMEGIKTKSYFLRSRAWKRIPKGINKSLQAVEFFIRFTIAVIRNKADIYHCHDLAPAIFAWIGKWIYGAQIVYDAHELEVDQLGDNGLRTRILSRYERKMMKSAAQCITVNHMFADIMAERYGKKPMVIENRPEYIPGELLDTGRLRRELNVPGDHVIVIYVGYLSDTRGIDKMVKALRYLDSHVVFYIMGTGRIEQWKTAISQVLLEEGIDSERVRFIGPFPPSEVINYLSGADISVLLYQPVSNNTLFNAPNKLFQSIVAQVPVVASHNKAFPLMISPSSPEAIGITVDPTDPESIAIGIRTLMDGSFYGKTKENLKSRSREVSWDSEKQKLTNMYKSLTNAM